MTLYRQLLIFTVCLFGILLAVVSFEKLESTRTFLENQLETHAQDTATFLGLSLSPIIADNDVSTADTMLNAVFDRGYYRSILLEDMEGKVLSEKVLEIEVSGVPSWFVKLVPIETPSAKSLIMSGWSQAGIVTVSSHPGHAYANLWSTAKRLSVFFIIAGVMVCVVGTFMLRYLLRPLKMVELQAEAISRKDYQIQKNLPKTQELRRVVESMNRMTKQIQKRFEEQARIAERLRESAYTDTVTGLGNRRYVTGQVEARLEAADGPISGAFLMIQLKDLQQVNELQGFEAGDTLLKKTADLLKTESKIFNDVALGRLTGGDFVMSIPGNSFTDTSTLADQLIQKISRLALETGSHSDNMAHIGGVVYDQQSPKLAELLSEADSALQGARQKGPNKSLVTVYSSEEERAIRGKTWWKKTLDNVFEKDGVVLFGQPVVSSKDQAKVLHTEILSRIYIEPGEIVSAGVFVPFAERMQLVSKLDTAVLQKVLCLLKPAIESETVAVNVSPSSLSEPAFVDWLLTELAKLPKDAPRFIFEFPEFGAVQYLDVLKDFSNKTMALGHGIGLDHFGQSFSNFGYLKSLKPEYVKIDRGFTKELENDQGDSAFFIESLSSVAHSLDIRVIAEGVEREEQAEKLVNSHVDALQGYFFGKPKEM